MPSRTVAVASRSGLHARPASIFTQAVADSGVDVTMVFPGIVATETRRNGLNGDGQRAGVSLLDEAGAMSVERCAAEAIAGLRTRRREVVMTTKGRLGLKIKAFAPAYVDRLALKALARDGGTT